ncbi:MAG TPA: beta-N-acetylhexosaminidase [Pseudonocardiaceae bacterium]|jgi:hexosaminidase|nr:beta-N-acetylhexosaminidase [Pseudonocardiaceae bacterium]
MSAFDLLLPRPVAVTPAEGTFPLDRAALTAILSQTSTEAIRFHIDPAAVQHAEGYRLEIRPDGVTVRAADRSGAFYATQTLRQLLGPNAFRTNYTGGTLPCGTVTDHPRFKWRGCLLDVARHFMPKAAVLRFIDLLAAHKLNIFHLHLTDDQGWRIEIPAFPRLTETGAWRTESRAGSPPTGKFDGQPHGGHYTTEDLREIVAYAADRAITVVPEIDIPGHTQAAIAAYPALGNTGQPLPVWTSWGVCENVLNVDQSTVDFFRAVFDQVAGIFPSKVIAVGGDEVPVAQWENSPAAHQRMAELGLTEVHELHGWFVREIVHHLATLGRRALGWDEIAGVGPVPPGTIIASWRGEQAGVKAAKAGYDVVMCPEQYVYLDHRQSTDLDEPIPVGIPHTLADVYGYEPIPADLTGPAADRALGAQAQIWTEHLDTPRRVDYAAFPRLAAFAEVVWTQPQLRDPADFRRRIETEHLARLDALGVEYRPLSGPLPWQRRPGIPGRPR